MATTTPLPPDPSASTNISPPQQQQPQEEFPSYTPFLPPPFNITTSPLPPPALITQGAEALLYRTHFLDASTPAALKVRPSKPYRHPTLDARLTKQRVLAEARVLVKLSGLRNDAGSGSSEVNVPAVLSLEWDVARRVKGAEVRRERGGRTEGGGAWLLMEWIDGESVKDLLRRYDLWWKAQETTPRRTEAGGGGGGHDAFVRAQEEDVKALLRRIGRAVGALHSKGGVIHGDLTTSNIMIRPPTSTTTTTATATATVTVTATPSSPPSFAGEIVLIDFGLATQSVQDEDRAVDLYVLERAFGSTHPRQEGWFDAEVLQGPDGYRGSFRGAAVVLKRLEDVRLRGRKRSMVG
ncbi:BUD32 protein kinase [Exophiala aquamarina CBS 119918]|uniref:EKC/KEOPS complex subunit BUD32 n=1 Tax=Exophiala aquamarina CBS 119918 TaxID=1182545 RepID=A0A072PEI1_9EURO|nr:BUD32 protein kinase [Exophiala aquamarina CBS 119918]KEF57693.1 BUD32 protein kinase [Exophiala aquamarina CBS 119918]